MAQRGCPRLCQTQGGGTGSTGIGAGGVEQNATTDGYRRPTPFRFHSYMARPQSPGDGGLKSLCCDLRPTLRHKVAVSNPYVNGWSAVDNECATLHLHARQELRVSGERQHTHA